MAGLSARRILLALLILAGVLAGAAPARAEQQRAVLDVSINGVPHSQSLVLMDDGQVWIDLESLTSAGVKVPGGDRRPWKDRTLVRLGSLAPRITYELDEAALALRLTVQPSLLQGTRVDLTSQHPDGVEYRHATSAFLNYGTSLLSVGSSSLSLEAGALGRQGARHVDDVRRHDRDVPPRPDVGDVRRSPPPESLHRGRHRRLHGRARRHRPTRRRVGVEGLLARPVLRALPDARPERRRDDAVAGRGLREQPAGARRAAAAGRLPARSPAAARRRGRHARRRPRCVRRRAAVRLVVLHQPGDPRARRAAVLVRRRRGAARSVFVQLGVRRPHGDGPASHRADRFGHGRRTVRSGIERRQRRPHGHRQARTVRRRRGHRRVQPQRHRCRLRLVARLRVHLAAVRRFAGGEELLVRLRDALVEICAGASQA